MARTTILIDHPLARPSGRACCEPAEADGRAIRARPTWRSGLPPLVLGHVIPRLRAEVDLARPRDFLVGVVEHLFPLRDPAGGARDREQDGKHVDGEAHRLVDETGVEVDVRIEL